MGGGVARAGDAPRAVAASRTDRRVTRARRIREPFRDGRSARETHYVTDVPHAEPPSTARLFRSFPPNPGTEVAIR
ncbi:hypothetical protein GCM10010319_12700 [Streptomyces blastmyceticus]|uniref:Uncharacterized protein n=1 Tax=Streptomyces blastmyceticus TaxID=68180 RepID=A0ABN0WHX3_9ACTN